MATVTLRLFAAARVAAGTGRAELDAATVGEALDWAVDRFGQGFAEVLTGCRVWRNDEQADRAESLRDGDTVAVLPPVSGG